jgi:serine/threonine protein kinase
MLKSLFNIDFGLSALHNIEEVATSVEDAHKSRRIRRRPNFNHTTCGTLSYIAPEILGMI